MATKPYRPAVTSATAMIAADLNVLRCFAGTGIHTCVASSDQTNLLFYSRYCREKSLIANATTAPEQSIADLVELGRSRDEKPVLYYQSDGSLLSISRYRDQLAPHYRFVMPPSELVEDLVDKNRFARLAVELDLPVPRSVQSSELKSSEEALDRVGLPCILKPNSRHLGWHHLALWSHEGNDYQKGLIAYTADEFRRMYSALRKLTDQFIVQPYISGGDECIYSFHGYFNADGDLLGHYVGRKIRTYPKNNGVSTYLELAEQPDVARLSLELLRKLRFVGPVKIDLKQDATTGQLHVLEINPRYTLWNYLGAACGINLPLLAYADQTGQSVPPQMLYRTNVRWLRFGNDCRSFLRSYRPAGELSLSRWMASLLSLKVYDVFAWTDPVPFILHLADFMMRALRSRLKVLGKTAAHWVKSVEDGGKVVEGKGK